VAAAVAGQDDADVDEQLADEAAEASGRLQRQLAAKLKLPVYQAGDGPYGGGNFVKGSKLSTTAVTLSSDDSKAYSVSKCGCITIWDIENLSRCFSQHLILQNSYPVEALCPILDQCGH
jgi:hypothetical protein